MKTCKHCGASLPDNATFCGECGKKIESEEVTNSENAESKKEKKKGKLWLILLIIALLAGLVATYFIVFANRVAVTFNPDNGTEQIVFKIKKGEKIDLPEEPVKDGNVFVEWTTKDGESFDFENTIIEEPMEFVAKWHKLYNINFIAFDEIVDSQIVEETKEVVIPNDPIVDGFKFDCWLYNGQKVNEPIIADADKDIVASFREYKPIKSMKFDNKYVINIDETIKTVIVANPSDWAENITYKIADTKIATVDEHGVVKGIKPGKTTLTATTETGITAKTEITVVAYPKDFELSATTINLYKGETATINVTKFEPKETTEKSLTYKSTNTNIATVDKNGKVTAVAGGKCTIIVETVNGIKKEVTVNVTEYKLTVTLNGQTSGDVSKILYYKPSNRPIINPTAELTTINASGTKKETINANDLTMIGGDDVLYYYGGEMYATGFGVKAQGFYGKTYTIHFEYTKDGKKCQSSDFKVKVEPLLEVYYNGSAISGGFGPSGTAGETVTFTLVVYSHNVDAKVTSGSAQIIQTTKNGHVTGNNPKITNFKMTFQKNNNGNTSSVKFTTPGGQELTITLY